MDKLKVFICDDSATVRERLVTMALDLPRVSIVGLAEDTPGCLQAILEARPDVVILDIRMPGGSGIDVLRQLKQSRPYPKVIMLTNFAYAQYRSKCQQAGADFFFDKSTEFDQIPVALELVRLGLRGGAAASPATGLSLGLPVGILADAFASESVPPDALPAVWPAVLAGRGIGKGETKMDATKDILQGKWHELSGRVKGQWGKLTDDDVARLTGKQEELSGLLQQRYGFAKAQADTEINKWLTSMNQEHKV